MVKSTSDRTKPGAWQLWMHLTREERKLLLIILVIILTGLSARHLHLSTQKPDKLPEPVVTPY